MSAVLSLVTAGLVVRSALGDYGYSYYWTSSVFITDDCDHMCYDGSVGNPWDLCTLDTWEHYGSIHKHCKCKCKWNTDNQQMLTVADFDSYHKVDGVGIWEYHAGPGSYEAYGNTGVLATGCGPDHRAKDLPFQNGVCTKTDSPCCLWGWCHGNKDACEHQESFDWSKTNKYCMMESLLKPIDSCDLSGPIQQVASNVDGQSAWDIGEKIAKYAIGAVPVVGSAFDLAIDCLEPYFKSEPANPINVVVDSINKRVDQLQHCVGQSLSRNQIDQYMHEFSGLIEEAVVCKDYSPRASNRVMCSNHLWMDMIGFMPTFRDYKNTVKDEKNFQNDIAAAYLTLLPHFDVIVHTYIAVATLAIETGVWVAYKGCQDEDEQTCQKLKCDRDTTLNQARKYLDWLIKWAHDAQNAIIRNARPKTYIKSNDQCTYKAQSQTTSWEFKWGYDCGDVKATRESHTYVWYSREDTDVHYNDNCDGLRQQRVWAKMDMGGKSDGGAKTCEFALRGAWACDKNKVFDALRYHGHTLVNNVNERLDKEWGPQFRRKYTTTLQLARVSLWKMKWASDDVNSCPRWNPYKFVEVDQLQGWDSDAMLDAFVAHDAFLARAARNETGGGDVSADADLTLASLPSIIPPSEVCVSLWKQCGGTGWYGPTNCCGDDKVCVATNPTYSSCVPIEMAEAEAQVASATSGPSDGPAAADGPAAGVGPVTGADAVDRKDDSRDANRGVVDTVRLSGEWKMAFIMVAFAGALVCVLSLGVVLFREKRADYFPVQESMLAV